MVMVYVIGQDTNDMNIQLDKLSNTGDNDEIEFIETIGGDGSLQNNFTLIDEQDTDIEVTSETTDFDLDDVNPDEEGNKVDVIFTKTLLNIGSYED